jgi:carbonic anhydrase/acetyltransferase-like protein (isoleucine patch superfamily)
MIRSFGDKSPKIADTAWVSEFAYVVGNVEVGPYSSIWPGVTVRGDGNGKIVIGKYVNIQENSVLHNNQMVIEDYVAIGHSVVVHCERVGTGTLLGNNSTVLSKTTIGRHCIIAANTVVLSGQDIPDESFITGIPGTLKSQVTQAHKERVLRTCKGMSEKAQEFKKSGL